MLLPNGVLPGIISVSSEFQFNVMPTVHGGCGVATLSMAESYGTQTYVPMLTIYQRMRAANRADANGVTQMGKIQAQAQADGFRVAASGYSQAWVLARLQEGAPVVVEPSHGQVLVDLITGQGMDAVNLAYHFNLIVGYWPGGYNAKAGKNLPAGYWFADPDSGATNPVVNGVRTRVINGHNLQFYSLANVAASAPIAALAIYPKVSIQPPAPPTRQPAGFPAGWSDDGTTLTYGGVAVVKGFRLYLLAHPDLVNGPHLADNEPIEPERAVSQVEASNPAHGAGSVQTFHKMRLVWTAKDGVYVMWIGDEVAYLERQKVGAAA